MGIQINGQTDIISATDGSLTIQGASGNLTGDLVGNVTGNVTVATGATISGSTYTIIASTNGSERVRITSSGNVGIGTDNPATPIHVSGKVLSVVSGTPTGTYNMAYNAHTNSGSTGLQISSGSNYSYFVGDGTNIILGSDQGTTGQKVTINRNCPDSSLVVDSSGKCGVGISSPLALLHVNGTSQPTAVIGPSFSSAHANSVGAARSVFVYIDKEPSSLTWSDGSNRNTLFSNSLYVRTPVKDSVNNPAIVIAENGGQATGRNSLVFWNDDLNGNSGYIKARLYTQVGSGYNSTQFFIDVADSARNIQNRFSIDVNGNFSGSASNDISDQRLKKNIQTITNPVDKIKSLTGRTFEWQERASMAPGTKYGFIAQEVEEVVPELVLNESGIRVFDENDNLVEFPDLENGTTNYSKSVQSSGITPILVEALKEAIARIETLEAEVAALKAQ